MFTLTEDHLKLLRKMYVGWYDCEYGAPEIDPKRPYGNSWVAGDIHEILFGNCPEDLDDELEDKYYNLHRETETALQIVLGTGKFEAGTYRRINPYTNEWINIKDITTFETDTHHLTSNG
jgi:hypothetical protein